MEISKREIADLRGVETHVECARCGKIVPFEEAEPEEGGEWECLPCWKRCEAKELGDQAKRILDEMCSQNRLNEIPGQDYLHADFEDAYDTLIASARKLRRVLRRIDALGREEHG